MFSLKIVLILFTLGHQLIFSEACFSVFSNQAPDLEGTVNKFQLDKKIFVHQYFLPAFQVSSFIIELPKRLIVVDAQLILPAARELLTYAKYLKKPISRIYITHAHPDHYFGLEVFDKKIPVYALAETIEQIKQNGQAAIDRNKQFMGDLIPNSPTLPNMIQVEGDEIIDGVLFRFKKVQNTEIAYTLVTLLPKYETMFIGDFAFNKVHLFLAEQYFDNWIKVLKEFQATYKYKRIFLGHNDVGDYNLFQENINYLEYVNVALNISNDFDYFKTKMVNQFPNFISPDFLDFYKSRFPKNVNVTSSIAVQGNDCYPEGIDAWNGRLYVGCFKTGDIQIIDLKTNQMIKKFDATGPLNSTWGLKIDRNKDLLFSCKNPQFGSSESILSEVRVFDLDGNFIKSWKLLNRSRCNALTLDDKGNVYISDVGSKPRILKINTQTGIVSEWKSSDLWAAVNGFGLSGVIFVKSSIYASGASNYFYKVDINSDGSAGLMTPVSIKFSNGSTYLMNGIDGSIYAGNNVIFFTLNDAGTPGSTGIVYKLVLDESGKSGTISIFQQNLKDPASLAIYGDYVLVSISQLGVYFQIDTSLNLPFLIAAYNLN